MHGANADVSKMATQSTVAVLGHSPTAYWASGVLVCAERIARCALIALPAGKSRLQPPLGMSHSGPL
jgi:precorrin isomerase